jgi:hypothetical protein
VARSLGATEPDSGSPFDEDPEMEATLNLRSGAVLRPVPPESRHHLVIIQPESAVRRVALPVGPLTIGRAPPCALLLEGPEISRAHCRVEVEGNDVSVTDLNSTNGTFIDNKRLSGTEALPHGALLRIGNYVMTCEYQSELSLEDADSTQRKPGFGEVTVLHPRRGGRSA